MLMVTVLASEPDSSVDFDSQILPILTKVGCNAGACHGAAAGRGGFHLSLFGSDAQADFASIVTYAEGRRVNLVAVSKSLVLAKPLGILNHGGDAAHLAFDPAQALDDLGMRIMAGFVHILTSSIVYIMMARRTSWRCRP